MRKFAFIDSQNLYRAVDDQGYRIDYRRLRHYLRTKYGITEAIMYFGYLKGQTRLYDTLKKSGFILKFRAVEERDGRIKGNVDIFLTISVMDMIAEDAFDEALLVTSDGDFYDLTERLKEVGKFGGVLSPSAEDTCSRLIRKSAGAQISFVPDLVHKFATKK